MRLSILLLAVPLASALPTTIDMSSIIPVSLPLREIQAPGGLYKRGIPRQGLLNMDLFYAADFQIGSPPQNVTLLVDTGSWVTWVNPNCTASRRPALCSELPVYNVKASKPPATRVPSIDQSVMYADLSGALLQGYSDVFTWGVDTKVANQSFLVANFTRGLYTGVLGLAPDGEHGFNAGMSNHSTITNMARQGIVKSRSIGLAIGAVTKPRDRSGSLIFGGVDKNKFSGPLFTVPILRPNEGLDGAWRYESCLKLKFRIFPNHLGRYWIDVAHVKHHKADKTDGFATSVAGKESKVFVDSGTTGIYIAPKLLNPILKEMGLKKDPANSDGFPIWPCNKKLPDGSIEFGFANGAIKVPYANLLVPRSERENDCMLSIGSAGSEADDGDLYSILGCK
jgi:hypothetical protein